MAIKSKRVDVPTPTTEAPFSAMDKIFPGVVPSLVQERQSAPTSTSAAPSETSKTQPGAGLMSPNFRPKFMTRPAPVVSGEVVAVDEEPSGPASSAISQNPEDRQDPDHPDSGDVAGVGEVEAPAEAAAPVPADVVEPVAEAPPQDEYLAGIAQRREPEQMDLVTQLNGDVREPSTAVVVTQAIPTRRRRRSSSKTPMDVAISDPTVAAIRTIPFVPHEGLMPRVEEVEESVRTRAKVLEMGFYALAEDLRYLKRMKRYVQLGYEDSNHGWVEYLDKHLQIAYKTAMDHIAIVDAAEAAKIPIEKVNELGPSKARLLRQVPVEKRAEFVEEVIHPTTDGHVPTFAEAQAKAQELAGQPVVRVERLSLSWSKDKYDTVVGLLKLASEMYEPDAQDRPDLSQAFYIIAMKWSQFEAKKLNLREHIEFLREQFPQYDITVTNRQQE